MLMRLALAMSCLVGAQLDDTEFGRWKQKWIVVGGDLAERHRLVKPEVAGEKNGLTRIQGMGEWAEHIPARTIRP